jgi:hypothetical protein
MILSCSIIGKEAQLFGIWRNYRKTGAIIKNEEQKISKLAQLTLAAQKNRLHQEAGHTVIIAQSTLFF